MLALVSPRRVGGAMGRRRPTARPAAREGRVAAAGVGEEGRARDAWRAAPEEDPPTISSIALGQTRSSGSFNNVWSKRRSGDGGGGWRTQEPQVNEGAAGALPALGQEEPSTVVPQVQEQPSVLVPQAQEQPSTVVPQGQEQPSVVVPQLQLPTKRNDEAPPPLTPRTTPPPPLSARSPTVRIFATANAHNALITGPIQAGESGGPTAPSSNEAPSPLTPRTPPPPPLSARSPTARNFHSSAQQNNAVIAGQSQAAGGGGLTKTPRGHGTGQLPPGVAVAAPPMARLLGESGGAKPVFATSHSTMI